MELNAPGTFVSPVTGCAAQRRRPACGNENGPPFGFRIYSRRGRERSAGSTADARTAPFSVPRRMPAALSRDGADARSAGLAWAGIGSLDCDRVRRRWHRIRAVPRRRARPGRRAAATPSGMISTPNDANERLALFQQLLAARSPDIDVFQIDVVWPGILAPYLLDLTPHVPDAEIAAHFPALVDERPGERPAGRHAVVRRCRAALLPARPSGEDNGAGAANLARAHRDREDACRRERAAGHARMWGFVWQGRAYEGLTCNALEWINSSGGGTIVDATGKVTIDNPRRGAGLDAGGILGRHDHAARRAQLYGGGGARRLPGRRCRLHAQLALRLALANRPGQPGQRQGRRRAAAARRARTHRAPTLGGSQLAVSRYSRAPDAAVDLVRSLTSAEEQKRRAITAGLQPDHRAAVPRPRASRGHRLP